MKRLIMVGLLLMTLAACGSSGGSGSSAFESAMLNSGNAFADLIDDDDLWTCIFEAEEDTTCDCPRDGTIEVQISGLEETYTADACMDSGGRIFTGAITTDDDGDTLTVDFDTFDECTDVTGGSIGNEDCSGSITGTCAGTTETCTISGSGDDCDYNCS